MNNLHILFLLAMLMSLTIADSATTTPNKEPNFFTSATPKFETRNSTKNPATPSSETEELSSLRGTKGFHSGHKQGHGVMTCDKYPRVCHVKGSDGPDCCHKKCVNVSSDRNNCGRCGKKCKYSQVCCKGKCVNTNFDKHHCGSCGNKCDKGDFCVYGLCNYA